MCCFVPQSAFRNQLNTNDSNHINQNPYRAGAMTTAMPTTPTKAPPTTPLSTRNGPKINRLMNTPNFLKTKFMSVLGSSNELINEISNRVSRES